MDEKEKLRKAALEGIELDRSLAEPYYSIESLAPKKTNVAPSDREKEDNGKNT